LIDDLDNSKYNNFDDIILQLNLDYFQFNFGPLPKEGERKSYEKTIKDQVKNYLKERAFLNPPLTSFGITILVKKVVTSKKDLDNIAKEIIEAIGEFLNPPTDQLNSLQADEIQFMNQRFKIDFSKNKKFPNVGFIGYQVLYLPTSEDETDEFVRLNIHGFKHGLSNCDTFPDYIDGRFNEISKYGNFK
jgi:Holliday junction resolvase RusA-like endonuclease